MHKLLPWLVLLAAISSCKTKQNLSSVAVPVHDTISDFSSNKIIRDKELFNMISERVPVDTAYFRQDTLHILTPAIRACDAENFKLFWNGKLAKSPQPTVLKLFQRVDVGCNESHSFHLTYNLKQFGKKHLLNPSNTDSASTPIRLQLAGNTGYIR